MRPKESAPCCGIAEFGLLSAAVPEKGKALQHLHKALAIGIFAAVSMGCRSGKDNAVFSSIDNDRSGSLTLEEVEIYGFKRMFARFDKDGDGLITPGDLQGTSSNLMRTRDLDRNGKVTLAEYAEAGQKQGAVKKVFRAADSNGDGLISEQETRNYLGSAGLTF